MSRTDAATESSQVICQLSRQGPNKILLEYQNHSKRLCRVTIPRSLRLQSRNGQIQETSQRTDVRIPRGSECKITVSLREKGIYHASEEQMFLPLPQLQTDQLMDIEIDGRGYIGSRWAFIGDYEQWSRRSDERRINLILPSTVDALVVPPSELLDLVVQTDEYLHEQAPDETTIFVADWSLASVLGKAHDADCIVQADAPAGRSSVRNTWIHEAVHTHQSLNLAEEMEWLTEGMARYLEMRINHDLRCDSHIKYEAELRDMAESTADNVVLGDPDTWSDDSEYRKGSLLVAMIDQYVRSRSNGKNNFVDVLNALNESSTNGTDIEAQDLVEIIETVTAQPLTINIERYIRTSDCPEPPFLQYDLTAGERLFLQQRKHNPLRDELSDTHLRQFHETIRENPRLLYLIAIFVGIISALDGENEQDE